MSNMQQGPTLFNVPRKKKVGLLMVVHRAVACATEFRLSIYVRYASNIVFLKYTPDLFIYNGIAFILCTT